MHVANLHVNKIQNQYVQICCKFAKRKSTNLQNVILQICKMYFCNVVHYCAPIICKFASQNFVSHNFKSRNFASRKFSICKFTSCNFKVVIMQVAISKFAILQVTIFQVANLHVNSICKTKFCKLANSNYVNR